MLENEFERNCCEERDDASTSDVEENRPRRWASVLASLMRTFSCSYVWANVVAKASTIFDSDLRNDLDSDTYLPEYTNEHLERALIELKRKDNVPLIKSHCLSISPRILYEATHQDVATRTSSIESVEHEISTDDTYPVNVELADCGIQKICDVTDKIIEFKPISISKGTQFSVERTRSTTQTDFDEMMIFKQLDMQEEPAKSAAQTQAEYNKKTIKKSKVPIWMPVNHNGRPSTSVYAISTQCKIMKANKKFNMSRIPQRTKLANPAMLNHKASKLKIARSGSDVKNIATTQSPKLELHVQQQKEQEPKAPDLKEIIDVTTNHEEDNQEGDVRCVNPPSKDFVNLNNVINECKDINDGHQELTDNISSSEKNSAAEADTDGCSSEGTSIESTDSWSTEKSQCQSHSSEESQADGGVLVKSEEVEAERNDGEPEQETSQDILHHGDEKPFVEKESKEEAKVENEETKVCIDNQDKQEVVQVKGKFEEERSGKAEVVENGIVPNMDAFTMSDDLQKNAHCQSEDDYANEQARKLYEDQVYKGQNRRESIDQISTANGNTSSTSAMDEERDEEGDDFDDFLMEEIEHHLREKIMKNTMHQRKLKNQTKMFQRQSESTLAAIQKYMNPMEFAMLKLHGQKSVLNVAAASDSQNDSEQVPRSAIDPLIMQMPSTSLSPTQQLPSPVQRPCCVQCQLKMQEKEQQMFMDKLDIHLASKPSICVNLNKSNDRMSDQKSNVIPEKLIDNQKGSDDQPASAKFYADEQPTWKQEDQLKESKKHEDGQQQQKESPKLPEPSRSVSMERVYDEQRMQDLLTQSLPYNNRISGMFMPSPAIRHTIMGDIQFPSPIGITHMPIDVATTPQEKPEVKKEMKFSSEEKPIKLKAEPSMVKIEEVPRTPSIPGMQECRRREKDAMDELAMSQKHQQPKQQLYQMPQQPQQMYKAERQLSEPALNPGPKRFHVMNARNSLFGNVSFRSSASFNNLLPTVPFFYGQSDLLSRSAEQQLPDKPIL